MNERKTTTTHAHRKREIERIFFSENTFLVCMSSGIFKKMGKIVDFHYLSFFHRAFFGYVFSTEYAQNSLYGYVHMN